MVPLHPNLPALGEDGVRGQLGAVVADNHPRLAAFGDQVGELTHHPTPRRQLIMDEVQVPPLVGSRQHGSWCLCTDGTAPVPPASDRQLHLAVESLRLLAVDHHPLSPQQDLQPTIANNPLYIGRLVWGRRQWRRNPDSEMRERRYRLRDRSEWIQVAVPDLRIIDQELWDAVRAEMDRRSISGEPEQEYSDKSRSPAGRPRKKHLLSGLIKCSCCGSNYTISGKDYYRCAGQKERGTCGNTLSVRKGAMEHAAMSVLQHHLLTEEHAKIFTETFNREVIRITGQQSDRDRETKSRLAAIERELANLAANMRRGVLSPLLMQLLCDTEAEKAKLESLLTRSTSAKPLAQIVPHPVLVQKFGDKIGALRETLNDDAVRTEAAELIGKLIESVTIYPDGANGPEAEIVSNVTNLAGFALNDKAAPRGGASNFTAVVAGAGFEPATFRL